MPSLRDPALADGTLRYSRQPRLAIEDGIVLRPWQESDAAAVQIAFGSPDLQRWHLRRLDSLDEAKQWTRDWAVQWNAETAASWAAADEEDRLLGQVGLRNVSLIHGSASLSYWVTPAASGRAIAAKSVQALSKWALEVMGFNRLNFRHSTANTASCRVAEQAGYKLEGTLRRAKQHADGWHDMHVHGQLRTDA